jgi:hypothetical protein
VHRDTSACGPDDASHSSTSSTADSHPGNAESRTESTR